MQKILFQAGLNYLTSELEDDYWEKVGDVRDNLNDAVSDLLPALIVARESASKDGVGVYGSIVFVWPLEEST